MGGMEKILISSCLAGERVRYDGRLAPLDHPLIREWDAQGRLIRFCPETEGGLPMPRPPAEIVGGAGSWVLDGTTVVKSIQGRDVSTAFVRGAKLALERVLRENIKVALLKEKSPSCGSCRVYDGTFSSTLVPGQGVTTALLKRSGIRVFSELQMDELKAFLNNEGFENFFAGK